MDFSEDTIKAEVSNFVSSLQRLLPKRKDIIVLEPAKTNQTRLSEVHAEAKSVFPKCFVGARLVVLRQVLDKVKLLQEYNYGKTRETYQSYKRYLNKESEPKFVGDGLVVDASGSATATYTERMDGACTLRLTSRIRDLVASETEVELEREGERSVTSFTFKMNDMEPNTLRTVTQWMYQLRPELSVGTELSFKPLACPALPELSLSARYRGPTYCVSSTVTKLGFQVCLYKRLAADLQLAGVLCEGRAAAPLTATLALHKAYEGCELKIFVDSQRCGGFTVQKEVCLRDAQEEERVLRLVGSALLDGQRRLRLGFGFNLNF
ncbi:Mitochondrial import receptor subunit TOM40-like [Papilio machaon]|uniref:Mitochondrial import receptor subunit TOM40-like n=1 Tax=Papilio machaon TaxID=76193 RepID=A0A194R5T4_PAPMA|nr:Mitochondrial import receptor subunit TOM40-like [Papilio machaon]